MKHMIKFAVVLACLPSLASADPTMECSGLGSQVEIGACVSEALTVVDGTIDLALGFARTAAADLDNVTGREVAVPALEAGQAAWSAYRDAHCEFVGATFGGGSGTGIAITSCRVELGRARVDELMNYVR